MASELVIKINGDIKGFKKSLDDAKSATEDLDDTLASVAKVSAVAFAALTGEVFLSVQAFSESEAASNKLISSLQNQGIYSDRLLKSYKDVAAALQKLTGVDDDQIVASQAVLQGFLGQTEVTEELTKAVLDLSVGKGIDLATAAEMVGKSIGTETNALARNGIALEENMTKGEKMAKVIDGINGLWKDQSITANQGLGSIKGLTAAFSDLQEEIGARFAPIITSVIQRLTQLFQFISSSPALTGLISGILAAGVVITGLVAGLATLGIAFTSAAALAAAFGTTTLALLGPIGVVAAAIIALGAAAGVYVTKTKNAEGSTEDLRARIAELRKESDELQKSYERIIKQQGPDGILGVRKKAEIDANKQAIAGLREELMQLEKSNLGGQDPAKLDAAKKRHAEENELARRKLESNRANAQLEILQNDEASKRMLELKKAEVDILKNLEDEKNMIVREKLKERLEDVRRLQEEQALLEDEQMASVRENVIAKNEEFQMLSEEQQVDFWNRNQEMLTQQQLTEKTAKEKIAQDSLLAQQKAHNDFLVNQQKFGTAYALINQFMHSAVVEGTKTAFGELAQLQTSSNSTLKAIGKGAAIANIVIKTAESAMNIYAGFSTIPIIGPALGVIGAAAAVAFGTEQVGKVNAAAQGGLLEGGIPGIDSIPVLAQQGELIAPRRSYDDVVNAAADQLLQQRGYVRADEAGGGQAMVEVIIGFKDNAFEIIEQKTIERERIGISVRGA